MGAEGRGTGCWLERMVDCEGSEGWSGSIGRLRSDMFLEEIEETERVGAAGEGYD